MPRRARADVGLLEVCTIGAVYGAIVAQIDARRRPRGSATAKRRDGVPRVQISR